MPLILTIDTSGPVAFILLQDGEKILDTRSNTAHQNHAAFVQPAIREIFRHQAINLHKIDAVSTVAGPGSYTGLRVGMASAKGICYALNIPLILLNSLQVMALACVQQGNQKNFEGLICPMIDARRMEVFTAMYDLHLHEHLSPRPLILDKMTFDSYLEKQQILFCGDGMQKFQAICSHRNAIYSPVKYDEKDLAFLSRQHFLEKRYASLAYSEPYYVKEFYTPSKH